MCTKFSTESLLQQSRKLIYKSQFAGRDSFMAAWCFIVWKSRWWSSLYSSHRNPVNPSGFSILAGWSQNPHKRIVLTVIYRYKCLLWVLKQKQRQLTTTRSHVSSTTLEMHKTATEINRPDLNINNKSDFSKSNDQFRFRSPCG